ncbi:hypothetical protein ACFXO9_02510 [Nocardia tengchongensis]|uniref:hypothetical protein n=1 Tax=Nocardia tengchongensis TaxID=2055889 RepID=UPI00369C5E7B
MKIAHTLGVAVGLALLLTGLIRLSLPVECHGHAMDLGQVCHDTEKGRPVTRSFDEQRSLRDSTDGFLTVGGLIVAAGSAVLLRRTLRAD